LHKHLIYKRTENLIKIRYKTYRSTLEGVSIRHIEGMNIHGTYVTKTLLPTKI